MRTPAKLRLKPSSTTELPPSAASLVSIYWLGPAPRGLTSPRDQETCSIRYDKGLRRCLASLVVMLLLIPAVAQAQKSPQKLFEAGKYADTIAALPANKARSARQGYLAGQAHAKLKQNSEARAAYEKLASGDEDSAWTFVGRSALAQLTGNKDEALSAAKKAVALNAKLAEAQYQLGLVLNAGGKYKEAGSAFATATKLKPDMAYAHYYAGMAYNKAKRVDLMATHFERFLKLAPAAPERPVVESVMRTVRGRR
jgi:tetratricopeptide (TPR) repeat protein